VDETYIQVKGKWKYDGSSVQDWEVESRPQSGTSNDVVKLRNVRYNRCLDSHAGRNGDNAYNIGCNTGNYQLWEVFYNNTRTFKSWGAWKNQGLHLCVGSERVGFGDGSVQYFPVLQTCNRNSAQQQWSKLP
jgi:hypothetical protein